MRLCQTRTNVLACNKYKASSVQRFLSKKDLLTFIPFAVELLSSGKYFIWVEWLKTSSSLSLYNTKSYASVNIESLFELIEPWKFRAMWGWHINSWSNVTAVLPVVGTMVYLLISGMLFAVPMDKENKKRFVGPHFASTYLSQITLSSTFFTFYSFFYTGVTPRVLSFCKPQSWISVLCELLYP